MTLADPGETGIPAEPVIVGVTELGTVVEATLGKVAALQYAGVVVTVTVTVAGDDTMKTC